MPIFSKDLFHLNSVSILPFVFVFVLVITIQVKFEHDADRIRLYWTVLNEVLCLSPPFVPGCGTCRMF